MSIYDPLMGTCQQWRGAWFLGRIFLSLPLLFAGMVEGDKCNTTKSLSSTGKYCPHQI